MRKRLIALFTLALIGTATVFGGWYYWTHRYDKLIVEVAQQYSLDPSLVKAIIYEESFFNPRARSSQNAVGLMQVTPIAAEEWMGATRSRSLGEAVAALPGNTTRDNNASFEEAFTNPVVSLHVGCWYIQTLLNRYKNERDPLAVALAAYNAGPTNVERWAPDSDRSRLSRDEFIARIEFPVTRNYVQKIITRYDYYKRDGDLNAAAKR